MARKSHKRRAYTHKTARGAANSGVERKNKAEGKGSKNEAKNVKKGSIQSLWLEVKYAYLPNEEYSEKLSSKDWKYVAGWLVLALIVGWISYFVWANASIAYLESNALLKVGEVNASLLASAIWMPWSVSFILSIGIFAGLLMFIAKGDVDWLKVSTVYISAASVAASIVSLFIPSAFYALGVLGWIWAIYNLFIVAKRVQNDLWGTMGWFVIIIILVYILAGAITILTFKLLSPLLNNTSISSNYAKFAEGAQKMLAPTFSSNMTLNGTLLNANSTNNSSNTISNTNSSIVVSVSTESS